VEEPRDSIPRDRDDRQVVDDVQRSSVRGSRQTSPAEDLPTQLDAVESQPPRPLFEDISDAEDDAAQSATPPQGADSSPDVSPVSLFHSPVGSASASVFDGVQSWPPCRVPDDDCSSSLPAAAAASEFFPAVAPVVPDVSFCPTVVSPPPSLEDMTTDGVVLTSAMAPLTIDTGVETTTTVECPLAADDVDAPQSVAEAVDAAQQRADDVTDTSDVTPGVTSPDVGRSPQAVTERSPPTASMPFEEAASNLSPSPPKIPRLRIVMGAGDASQSARSPGSCAASLPYVVTVDGALADVADQSASPPPRRDVTDDVNESSSPPPSVESLSRQQRKVRHKVRLVIVNERCSSSL